MEPDKTEIGLAFISPQNSEECTTVLQVPRMRARDHWQYHERSIDDYQ